MKSNLRQFGAWDSELDAKAREVLELRYAESSETFDFTVCQRPNGTYYGIAIGKNCIKGQKVNRVAVLGALAKRGVPREILGKIARVKGDKEFGKAVQAIDLGRKKLTGAIKPAKPTVTPKVKGATPKKDAAQSTSRAEKLKRLKELRAKVKERKAQVEPEKTKKPMNREDALSYLRGEGLLRTDRQKDLISKLGDDKLSRLVEKAKLRAEKSTQKITGKIKSKGELDETQAKRAAEAVRRLKYNPSGGKKVGGDNLQSPEQAGKYVEFYAQRKDLTYKAPFDTDPKVVKATLAQLKEEMPSAEYTKLVTALSGKGSPEKAQFKAAGWTSTRERGEAVLKSLMDNDFRDVLGQELSWRTGMQLDHRKAGSSGGSDRPNNWIWISSASNQAKGSIERELKSKKMSGEEAEKFLNTKLVATLKQNASMSADEVHRIKEQGSAGASAKAERRAALRDNMPLMNPSQIDSRISSAKGPELKDLLQASVNGSAGAAFLKKTVRGQTSYPTSPQAKSMLRMRWGLDLSDGDLRNIGQAIASSTYDSRSKEAILQIIEERFGGAKGLTAAQKKIILAAAV